VKVAIQPFNSKKVDLPDKITTGFNNRLVDSLLKKSNFKINIKPETSRGMREIEALANFFSSKQNSDWSQDYLKIFIHKKNNIFSRGQRTIPSMSEIFGNK
jgi:hypothetical protein